MIIELLDVSPYDDRRMMCTVDVTDDEGQTTKIAHFIPYDTAEWRIAEYELDPTDPDTIIDILLWEGHADADVPEELKLYRAPTVAEAREALVGAVRARKVASDAQRQARQAERLSRLTGAALAAAKADEDPEESARAKMRGLCIVQDETVRAKREHVLSLRAVMETQRSRPAGPASATERAKIFNPILTKGAISGDDHDPSSSAQA